MNKILALILEAKKKKIEVFRRNEEALLSLIKKAPPPLAFAKAIKRKGKISFIAEIKQASPSSGVLRRDFNPVEIAKIFETAGVNAISVLTEEEFFLGKINFIEDIRKEVHLPLLRKDFILEEVQVLESRAVGADAILLIMRILDENKFKRLYDLAKSLEMDVLVEVHTEKELRKVLKFGVDLVGINNRSLNTLKVNLAHTEKLAPFIPAGVAKVSESGINSLKNVLWLKGLGVDAVLVGEALMKAERIEDKIKELHIDC